MRDLFTVEKGCWYVGTDAAALENRTVAAYTMKYDGGKFADIVLNGDSHCYSEDTEILTEYGWKRFGDLDVTDKVAQWDNGKISFVLPSHIVWQDYEGEMIHFKSGAVDMLVTPNHRVCYTTYRNPKVRVKLAKDIPENNSSIRIPVSGETLEAGLSLSDSEVKFLVAVQADGYLYKDDYRMEFCFVKDRKIARMTDLLDTLGYYYYVNTFYRKGREEVKFRIRDSEARRLVDTYLDGKKFSTKFLKMNLGQAKVFIEELAHWDGTYRNNATIWDTTCLQSRDIAAAVATLAGYKPKINSYAAYGNTGKNGRHRLYINMHDKGEVGLLAASKTIVPYKGKIGCVSVPSSFVVVRRNDRIIVSGNTLNVFAFFPHVAKQFDINEKGLKDRPDFKPYRDKAKTGA